MSLRMSASQTVGPFFRIGLGWAYAPDFAPSQPGERVYVHGRVLDGAGAPIPDAVLEVWQADAEGRYGATAASGPQLTAAWCGFGRVATDDRGAYAFHTIKPGRVAGPDSRLQAPHLALHIFMRGLLKPVHTRLYFPDEPANADDPVLALVPPARRATLIARAEPDAHLAWDVHAQGPQETVFFQF